MTYQCDLFRIIWSTVSYPQFYWLFFMIYFRDGRIFYFGFTINNVLLFQQSKKLLSHFYFVGDLLMKYHMAKWNLFVKSPTHTKPDSINSTNQLRVKQDQLWQWRHGSSSTKNLSSLPRHFNIEDMFLLHFPSFSQ